MYPILALIVGAVLGLAGANLTQRGKIDAANSEADKIRSRAQQEADRIRAKVSEKREKMEQMLADFIDGLREGNQAMEKRLEVRQKQADRWDQRLGEIEQAYESSFQEGKNTVEQANQLKDQQLTTLYDKTGLDQEKVVETLEQDLEQKFQMDYENYLQKSEIFTKDKAPKRARRILQAVMNRYSEPSSVDRKQNTVKLKRDIMKGKLIGKDGKYINYFEKQAQVAVVFNDQEPLLVTVSTFHLLRREIGRRALESLSKKRKIDFEEIDQALEQARAELDVELEKTGRWAADIIELPEDKRDPKLLRLMGRLKYRTSYGQNILFHSLEIAFFSAMMAAEIDADVEIAKLGGFFHDLGKAIDQDDGVDKPHDYLSKDILEEFDFSWEIVHAAWTHHDAIPIETIEAEIVKAADAISAGRPGARSESSEDYYARIEALEKIATSKTGVQKVYAMSAGRELRTFVDPKRVRDEDMLPIAEAIRDEIEENVAYPGKVKVNLVRSMKAVDYAKEQQAS